MRNVLEFSDRNLLYVTNDKIVLAVNITIAPIINVSCSAEIKKSIAKLTLIAAFNIAKNASYGLTF